MTNKEVARRLTWLPVVERGCCCSLETCNKVQGYILLIMAIVEFILRISLGAERSNVQTFPIDFCFVRMPITKSIRCAHVEVIVGCILFAIVSSVFLVGIYTSQPRLISVYVSLLHVALAFLYLAMGAVILLDPLMMLPLLAGAGVLFYMLICANSLQLKMALDDGADRCRQEVILM